MNPELVKVENLSIAFQGAGHIKPAVDAVNLTIMPGEIVGLVGESGSGKTLLARAIVGLMPSGARITSGKISFDGQSISASGPNDFYSLRGKCVSFVFQEPLSSLNPSLRIGLQLTEGLIFHHKLSRTQSRAKAEEMLERVRISNPHQVMEMYPHELSGGMRQRVMIATALILKPALMIADEPTTALDMIVQEEVLMLMKEVAQDVGAAILLISHDLSAVASLAQSVSVMNEGRIVEQGSIQNILKHASDPYTRKLLAATPKAKQTWDTPATASGPSPEPILKVHQLSVSFPGKKTGIKARNPDICVLDKVSFEVAKGETLAIIGESGSGKTTLSRTIIGLQTPVAGEISFQGNVLRGLKRTTEGSMQMIFQDPFSSLDPRLKIGEVITEGLMFSSDLSRKEKRVKAIQVLKEVGLEPAIVDRYPHQLSGGQRQRVSIARAIILYPDFIIADEPVSALDLTVQKQILELLLDLKKRIGFACLFVSHDLAVVEQFADRVGVLYRGRLVEIGSCEDIFTRPFHPYTRKLLCATPQLASHIGGEYILQRREYSDLDWPGDEICFNPTVAKGRFHYKEFESGHFVAMSGESDLP